MNRHDSIEMLYVNPYDVLGNTTTTTTTTTSQQHNSTSNHQDDTIATLDNNLDLLNGGKDYKYKLPMEEFSDLSAFLPMTSATKSTSEISVDELNTPVIDKEAFNFTSHINNNYDNVNQNINNIKEEIMLNDCVYENNNMFNTTNNNDYLNDISVKMENHLNNATIAADSTTMSFNNHSNNNIIINRIESSYIDDQLLYNDSNKNSVLNIKPVDDYSNVSSPNERQDLMTTDDSNASIKTVYPSKNQEILKLNVNQKAQDIGFDLNTPDIIESVVNLENSAEFNFLNLTLNREDYAVINEDIISALLDADTEKPSESAIIIEEPHQIEVTKRPTRKRKTDDDDDEDYVPPKRFLPATHHKKSSVVLFGDDESLEKSVQKRGRRSVRSTSMSSDGSKDSDVSKYRELRDKNNEASKKSRLKRKMKEYMMEKEADELNEKNIKLKARVAELERMVNSFRNNLFKTLINK